MSFRLLGLATGETEDVLSELDHFGGTLTGTTGITIGTTSFTGNFSIRNGSSNLLRYGFVFQESFTELRMGYYLNHSGIFGSSSTSQSLFFAFKSGNSIIAAYRHKASTDSLYLTINGVENPTPIVTMNAAGLSETEVWKHIGYTLRIDGANSFFSMYVNGLRVANYNGGIIGSIDLIEFSQATGNQWAGTFNFMDDMYVAETIGEPDVAPSAKRFLLSKPNADGSDTEFDPEGNATNIENIEDFPHDGDLGYNKSNIVGVRDTFERSPITVPVDHRIRAVIPYVIARKTDSETDSRIKLHMYDGSTYQSSDELFLPVGYQRFRFDRQTTQPDSSDWEETDFNNMESGYEAAGNF